MFVCDPGAVSVGTALQVTNSIKQIPAREANYPQPIKKLPNITESEG
jgi:hypothetical protein